MHILRFLIKLHLVSCKTLLKLKEHDMNFFRSFYHYYFFWFWISILRFCCVDLFFEINSCFEKGFSIFEVKTFQRNASKILTEIGENLKKFAETFRIKMQFQAIILGKFPPFKTSVGNCTLTQILEGTLVLFLST